MKKLLLSCMVFLLSAGMIGCSSNTQNENIGVGVVTGAVIGGVAGSAIGAGVGRAVAVGAGAVVGALIGGAIGESMDSSDRARMYTTMNVGHTNHATTWVNSNTGATYTIIPTSRVMRMGEYTHCRKYYTTVRMHGKKKTVYGMACRQPDGSWIAVR